MSSKKSKSPKRYRLLVPVIHDDLEKFHYPGEVGLLYGKMEGCICLRIEHDTLLLNSEDIEPLAGCNS